MKTIIIRLVKQTILILTLFLGFHIPSLMAKSPAVNNPINATDLSVFSPVVPKTVDFNNIAPDKEMDIIGFALVVPKEATFTDEDFSSEISSKFLKQVAPETPSQADFNDYFPDFKLESH